MSGWPTQLQLPVSAAPRRVDDRVGWPTQSQLPVSHMSDWPTQPHNYLSVPCRVGRVGWPNQSQLPVITMSDWPTQLHNYLSVPCPVGRAVDWPTQSQLPVITMSDWPTQLPVSSMSGWSGRLTGQLSLWSSGMAQSGTLPRIGPILRKAAQW